MNIYIPAEGLIKSSINLAFFKKKYKKKEARKKSKRYKKRYINIS